MIKPIAILILSLSYLNAQVVATLAGNGLCDSISGSANNSSFCSPASIILDNSNNLYVADFGNSKIRKISSNGNVSNYAGTGVPGNLDGTCLNSQFNGPYGLVFDLSGNLYVSDLLENVIKKISPTCQVTTFAGSGIPGNINATGILASFYEPAGITIDLAGNLYIADSGNNLIRKISSSGVVTTFAGSGITGSADGMGIAASFNTPTSLAVDVTGNIFVSDLGNNKIRKITASGTVTTFAGNGTSGNVNGLGTSSSFNSPVGLVTDAIGNIYVADQGNNKIRKINSSTNVLNYAGSGSQGSLDGSLSTCMFNQLKAFAFNNTFSDFYISDAGNNKIRKINLSTGINSIPYFTFRDVHVFPNPCNSILNIVLNKEFENTSLAKFVIYNSYLQQVLQQESNDSDVFINIENLPKGIYILKINLDQKINTTKIIKN